MGQIPTKSVTEKERKSKNDETSEFLARELRRGFSANTFPIAYFLASLWPCWGMFKRECSLSIFLFPFFDTCPSGKFPRIALSRRTSRCPTRVPPIRARIMGGEKWECGAKRCLHSCVSPSNGRGEERKRERMKYALSTILSSTDAATSCKLQNCLNGDNAVPWQAPPPDSLSFLPRIFVYGVLLRTRQILTV